MIDIKNGIKNYYQISDIKLIKKAQKDYIFYTAHEKYYLQFINEYNEKTIYNSAILYMIYSRFHYGNQTLIYTKNRQLISNINGNKFLLVKFGKNNNCAKNIVVHNEDENLNVSNWGKLWSNKVDWLESMHKKVLTRNVLAKYIDYFIGLTECAIAMFEEEKYNNKDIRLYLQHRRYSRDDYYNTPLNLVVDYRVRDLAEKIKYNYLYGDHDYTEIEKMVKFGNYTKQEYKLLLIRLMYPSIFFDIYAESINDSNYKVNKIIEEKLNNYSKFIKKIRIIIYNYIKKES